MSPLDFGQPGFSASSQETMAFSGALGMNEVKNGFVTIIESLRKGPISGIDSAAAAIPDIIKGIQDMSAAALERAQGLGERLFRVDTLVKKIDYLHTTDSNSDLSELSDPLKLELVQLSRDMESAKETGTIEKFFTQIELTPSVVVHEKVIDDLPRKLMGVMCQHSNYTKQKLKADLDALVQNLRSTVSGSASAGFVIDNNTGKLMSDWTGSETAQMVVRGNNISEVGGDTLSNIHFGRRS